MSAPTQDSARLDRPVDPGRDHTLGPATAPITLVEYGSYACPHCRVANERIGSVRTEFGDRLRYVFRHRPLTGSDIARRAAELAETAPTPDRFWDAHVALMTRSTNLSEEDVGAVAEELGLAELETAEADRRRAAARERVDADVSTPMRAACASCRLSSSMAVATTGPGMKLLYGRDARIAQASRAHRSARVCELGAVDRRPAAPGDRGRPPDRERARRAGLRRVLAHGGRARLRRLCGADVASGLGERRAARSSFWSWGSRSNASSQPGAQASRRSAALPIAAAIGGMAVPALIYLALMPQGPWSHGWGVPMATDTAFAVALIAMMGARVPIELRVFLTAAAIVDDIGAIIVVAIFYSGELQVGYIAGAAGVTAALAMLNRSGVYRASPYVLLGIALWACVHASGLHATLAGVILAAFIPTRPPPDYRALMLQADTILDAEASHGGEQLRHGPRNPPCARSMRYTTGWNRRRTACCATLGPFELSRAAGVRACERRGRRRQQCLRRARAAHARDHRRARDRQAARVLRRVGARRAARAGRQARRVLVASLAGAGALAGIGFTMSLFIAGQAFPAAADFAAAKVAVFVASVLSAVIGVAVLWRAPRPGEAGAAPVRSDVTEVRGAGLNI